MRRSNLWRRVLQRSIGLLLLWPILTATTVCHVDAWQDQSQESTRPNLDAAIQVANWLDSMAIPNPNGEGQVWKISDARPQHDLSLYSGSSGVALFYLQLYRQTDDERYLTQAIEGGTVLAAAVEGLDDNSPAGFWVGYSGYAYVLNELAAETDNEDFTRAAHRMVDRLLESVSRTDQDGIATARWSDVTDLISGNAGIGQFLLYASNKMDRHDALLMAIDVANGLLADAIEYHHPDETRQVDQHGDSAKMVRWMMSPQYEREMPNFSHGTAGVADFLLNLHLTLGETDLLEGDDRFLTAAQAGAAYLGSIAVVENEAAMIAHHFPGGEQLFYLGWCHGPAGTGRFLNRMSAHEANETRAAADRELTWMGIRAITDNVFADRRPDGFWNNVGLCCGSAGVASYLIDASLDLPETDDDMTWLLDHANALNDDLLRRAELVEIETGEGVVTGLKWTHAEHRVRPELLEAQTGFMQGAAGIGLWLLRLDAIENGIDFPYRLPLQP